MQSWVLSQSGLDPERKFRLLFICPHGSIWDRVSHLLTFQKHTDNQFLSLSGFGGPSPATPSLNTTNLFLLALSGCHWEDRWHLIRRPCILRRQVHLDLFSSQGPSSQLKIPWRRKQRQPRLHPRKTKTALLGNEWCPSWMTFFFFGLIFNLRILEKNLTVKESNHTKV